MRCTHCIARPLRAYHCRANLPIIQANRRDVRLGDSLKNAFQNPSHCIPDLRIRGGFEKTGKKSEPSLGVFLHRFCDYANDTSPCIGFTDTCTTIARVSTSILGGLCYAFETFPQHFLTSLRSFDRPRPLWATHENWENSQVYELPPRHISEYRT